MKKQRHKPTQQKEVPFDVLFRRWRNKVEADGIMNELRKREYYEKPAERRQRKKAAAIARQRRITSELTGESRKRKY